MSSIIFAGCLFASILTAEAFYCITVKGDPIEKGDTYLAVITCMLWGLYHYLKHIKTKYMTIQEKLYNYYREAIEEINNTPKYKQDLESCHTYISRKGVQAGICYCALEVFKYDLYGGNPWIKDYITIRLGESGYWAKEPIDSDSVQEVIELLTIRLNNLEKEVKRIKNEQS